MPTLLTNQDLGHTTQSSKCLQLKNPKECCTCAGDIFDIISDAIFIISGFIIACKTSNDLPRWRLACS